MIFHPNLSPPSSPLPLLKLRDGSRIGERFAVRGGGEGGNHCSGIGKHVRCRSYQCKEFKIYVSEFPAKGLSEEQSVSVLSLKN